MEGLILLVVIGTTIWVGADASNLRQRTGRGVGGNVTFTWVVVCLLLWIIGFPLYLVQRAQFLRELQCGQPPAPPLDAYGRPGAPQRLQIASESPYQGVAGYYSSPSYSPVQPAAPAGLTSQRTSPDGGDLTAQLERLGRLRADGHLSDEEFAALKRRLLTQL